MYLFPDRLTPESGKEFRDSIMEKLKTTIDPVKIDTRDQWPLKPYKYVKSHDITKGEFGSVRVAECRDQIFGFSGPDSRRCVIKKIYFKRKIESFIIEKARSRDELLVTVDEKLYRFWRRTIMDIYVLTRCRHENIMHLHALFIFDGDLNIVLPRFYILKELIQAYRTRHNNDPMPMTIIGKIIRQICIGLDYLNKTGIVHRDVQPENIFLTRNGTIKLGHFGQSKSIVENRNCITPVGKFEFMSFEKQFNFKVQNRKDCLSYTSKADTWSLGVLVLQMISYFPDEPYQKLPKDFADLMHEEKMPFGWLIANMMQLRSRLSKSGGEELKNFLSAKLLTVTEAKRATPNKILKSAEMKLWCCNDVEEDKVYLRKKFINDLDFANQKKIENDSPNYDVLESKNILPEFYWDDRWKILDDQIFKLEIIVEDNKSIEGIFRFGHPSPLFRILNEGITEGYLDLSDFLIIEPVIDNMAFEIIEVGCRDGKKIKDVIKREAKITLPPRLGKNNERQCQAVLQNEIITKKDSLGWSTDSDAE